MPTHLLMVWSSLVLLTTLGALGGQPALAPPPKPNIILILADDLGAKELSCYGSQRFQTPNLDRMAAEGVRFETFYATPLCTPTRVALMTGQYGFHNGFLGMQNPAFKPAPSSPQASIGNHFTHADLLKSAGYVTALAGKWQLSGQIPTLIHEAGFDEYRMWAYDHNLPPGVQHPAHEGGPGSNASRYWHPSIVENGKYLPTQPTDFGPDLFNNFVIDFARRHKTRPFFVYYTSVLTHGPRVETPDPAKPGARRPAGLKSNLEYLDHLMGRLLAALKAQGLDENTLVIFIGDNGTGGEGKGTVTELGVRVPCIIRGPGVRRGVVSGTPADLTDIMPTLAEFSGAALPKDRPFDGRSLGALLRGETAKHRDWIYSHLDDGRLLRDTRWLLQIAREGAPWRFFDCGQSRDGMDYKDVSDSSDAEVKAARERFASILATLPEPKPREGAAPAAAPKPKKKGKARGGAAARPNVVIFLADDSGWGDYSFNGNTNLQTPNLDALARSGAVFDRFYVCSVCAPTRAEFLTGRYHPRGGVRGVSTGLERLNTDEKTLADAFKAAGYATGAFGKWHNGSQWPYHPNARGFDEYYGFTSGHWGEYFNPPLEHNGRPVRGKGFIADDLAGQAIEFIERNRALPFLCYLPFNTPHSPWAVPDEFWQRFKDKPIAMRARDGDKEEPDHTRCALAMVENLDWNVGRVLQRLDDFKLASNTIVLYFSDNGPNSWRWNGGMKGRKGSTDEGGLRSPLFIRWPAGGIQPGTVVREIAGAIDLLPTLTALAGVPRLGNKPLDGRDLSPLLLGRASPWPERLIFSHQNGNVSARSQQYRFDNRGALFDMFADPLQTRSVAQEKPDLAAQFAQAVAAWRADVLKDAPDDRPYPVGYVEFPRTPLPARDGVPHGGLKRSAAAPNCSYFVNWTSLDDTITWDIAVHTTGNYDVEILYTCPLPDAGSTIALEFNGSRITGQVTPGWDPPLYTNQDTVLRPPGESQMKQFRALPLGPMRLEEGRGLLTLRALKIPGRTVMDVRQINLTLEN